jgi:myo-inositol catabolism protein IolS
MMLSRTLGSTGLEVSEVAFGAWAIGGARFEWAYGPTDDACSLAAVRQALECGCTFFDTADVYGRGHSERLLAASLRGCRPSVVIATKIGFDFYHGDAQPNFHPAYLRFALHQSLRRLETDHVDILLLHNPPPQEISRPEVVDALTRLKEQGKARAIGVSAQTVADAAAALAAGWPEVVQVPYNMMAPEAESDVFPAARAARAGVVVREALANGLLSGKYGRTHRFGQGDIRALWPEEVTSAALDQVEALRAYRRNGESLPQLAIRFALEPIAVSSVVCGCKTADHARENFASAARRGRALPQEV